ncbi:hypothetical protein JCM10212_002596 [Sporobolomyces blumeae]
MLMDQTQGTEMERLWALLGELSAQLSHNRQQTEELHRRADELRSQAVHSQTGFTLRRFNVDVSQEEFESELERLNVSLVVENQALQQENRQLSSLLKDYESTLEAVMAKFRAHAHATQQHHLELTRHYESLLLSMPVTVPEPDPSDPDSAPPIDPLHLQLSLAHLSSLIRKALRALQGEDPEDSTSPLLLPVGSTSPFDHLRDSTDRASALASSVASGRSSTAFLHPASFSSLQQAADRASDSASTSSASSIASYASSGAESDLSSEHSALLLASHHPPSSRTPLHDPASGGYIGRRATSDPLYIPTTSTSSLVASPPKPGQPIDPDQVARSRGLGPLDDALDREVEIEALRRENLELKKLLGIVGEDDDDDDDRDEGSRKEDAGNKGSRAAAGGGQGDRKRDADTTDVFGGGALRGSDPSLVMEH